MSRHCRHCRPGCQGASPVRFGAPRKHYDLDYSAWSDGHCPACAEAERIAAALLDEYDEHEDIAVLAALRIVRGEA